MKAAAKIGDLDKKLKKEVSESPCHSIKISKPGISVL
jgi:hypothetical protein